MDIVPYPSVNAGTSYDNRANGGKFGDDFDQWDTAPLVIYMRNLEENRKDDHKLHADLGGIKTEARLVVPEFDPKDPAALGITVSTQDVGGDCGKREETH